MKIGFVYDMIYPYSTGGAEKRIYHLARRLARRHEVHWVGSKLWKGSATIVNEDGVTLHGVLRPPGQMYVGGGRRALLQPIWFGAALLQWPGLRQMDVVDCASFPFFSIFTTRALGALGRTPVVVTWHEFWGDYWKEYSPRVAPIGRLVERLAVRWTPTAISVSEHTRNKLITAGMKPSRVTVIPNGIEGEKIGETAALPNAPDILFAGRLIREKRVDLLLEALAREPLQRLGATCWVIGDGSDAPRLKRLAATLGLDERVSFPQWMPEDQIYGAMKGVKAVALLSEREGFGMVVLEAMACGTPVVVSSSENSAASDLVSDGESGYVTPPDPTRISEALAAIVGSPELRASMGAHARERARGYDWDSVAERAEAVYLQAAAGRPPRQTPAPPR